jgi:ribosomal protein L12E/L44/L45/RPP1/RPP2
MNLLSYLHRFLVIHNSDRKLNDKYILVVLSALNIEKRQAKV